ncbi:hypothetical protein thsrh120_33660 [Rhizobium sp. No.120]
MISLLILTVLYLLAALVLILIIDRSVGIFFPASPKQSAAARHDRRFRLLPGNLLSGNRHPPRQLSEPFL